MSLVNIKDMLTQARAEGYAVGAFEFWSLDSAFAIAEAAQELNMPVILQVGHYERDYMYGYPNSHKIATIAAQSFSIPIALHLDHAEDYAEVQRALDAGFTSVMIDGSMLPMAKNIQLTQKVVKLAKSYNASVEAELGQLLGDEGGIGSDYEHLTHPLQAKDFVQQTNVDALAVAIGTAHGFYTTIPKIDIDRLKEIASLVSIPLVLHGGSGTPDNKVIEAIANGIAKVNICTEFVAAYGTRLASVQQENNFSYNVFKLFKSAQVAAKELVKAKIKLFTASLHKVV